MSSKFDAIYTEKIYNVYITKLCWKQNKCIDDSFWLILLTVTPMSVSIKDLQGLPLKLLISCISKLQFLKLYDQLYAANFSRNCLSYQCENLRIDRQVCRWPRLLIYVKNAASACWAQKLGTQILTNFCWFFHI